MRGYSQLVVEANEKADPQHMGVMLGRACIAHKIPASVVAEELDISRQTVYHWFSGSVKPAKEKEPAIHYLIQRLAEKN